MKTFEVQYTETADYSEIIEAETLDEAKNKFLELLATKQLEPYDTEGQFFNEDEEGEEI